MIDGRASLAAADALGGSCSLRGAYRDVLGEVALDVGGPALDAVLPGHEARPVGLLV